MDDSDASDSASSNPSASRFSFPPLHDQTPPRRQLSPYQVAIEDLSDYDPDLFGSAYIASEDDDAVSLVSHHTLIPSSPEPLFNIAEDDDGIDDDEDGAEEEDEEEDNQDGHHQGDRNGFRLPNPHRHHWSRRWQRIHQVDQILQGFERQAAMDGNHFLPGSDELIHVLMERSHGEAARDIRRDARRRHAEPPARPQEGQAVIDLTGEPDSPVQSHRSIQAQPDPQPRNPRRQMSQSGRTPSLARSDGSILGSNSPAPQVPIIDLTGDSPEDRSHRPRQGNASGGGGGGGDGAASQANNRRQAQPGGSNGGGGSGGSGGGGGGLRDHRDSPEVAFMGIFARLNELNGGLNSLLQLFPPRRSNPNLARIHPADELEIIGQNPVQRPNAIVLANPLLGNPVHFNYQANGFGANRGEPPKPPHVPPPAAREGFTRNTGEDVVAVCASCEEELKYDPEAADGGPPAKRARTKKDREEHHFWAVPECGHVYCRLCFDNRRAVLKKDNNDVSIRFQVSGKLVRCAVVGCDSDVTNKRNWVGIFL